MDLSSIKPLPHKVKTEIKIMFAYLSTLHNNVVENFKMLSEVGAPRLAAAPLI